MDKRRSIERKGLVFNRPFANLGFKVRDGEVGLYDACKPHKILDCKLCKQRPEKEKKPDTQYKSAQERDKK